MNYEAAERFIIHQLQTQLSPTLYYHGVHHTQDVIRTTRQLAAAEGVVDPGSMQLVCTAACFHDAGFLTTYQGHEERGCQVAREVLPQFAYTPEQIDAICAMIRATKIPQSPGTHLAQILCDADLDYLGRDDFEPIADSLFRELRARDLVASLADWNRLQVNFLEAHHYWTPTAISWRGSAKLRRLDTLRTIINAEASR